MSGAIFRTKQHRVISSTMSIQLPSGAAKLMCYLQHMLASHHRFTESDLEL